MSNTPLTAGLPKSPRSCPESGQRRLSDAVRILLALAFFWAGGCLSADLPSTIDRVKASIVTVGTYQRTRSPPFVFRGTGFVIVDGTLIATSAHVVPEQLRADAREVLSVTLPHRAGGAIAREASIVAIDRAYDVAVLRINGAPLPPLMLAEDSVREGQIFAFTGFPIGNVFGLSPVTHRAMVSSITAVALPIVNAKQLDSKLVQRLKTGFSVFQLDATAYPGSSGSPLYDMDSGRVVAIVNMGVVKRAKEAAIGQPSGITFAVPVSHLRDLVNAIQKTNE